MSKKHVRGSKRRFSSGERLAAAVVAVIGVGLVILIVRNLQRHDDLVQWRSSLETRAGNVAWPEWSDAWPALPVPKRRNRMPHDLHGPYAYAATHAELLKSIPCYCGCVREGHSSVLQCYISAFRQDGTPIWTDHSFDCQTCVHIVREVMLLSSAGMSLSQVRNEIDTRYSPGRTPTNTPFPSHSQH